MDISEKKNYVVPALWILGDAQLEDYSSLVHDLAFDKTHSTPDYLKARKDAAELFYSAGFKRALDAGGEKYEDEWSAQENMHGHRETAP